ncbi:hypothetical protein CEP53_004535 [Fusarium sp. AF-6]|nr:hypothetical protein CEP53_004535 [Fusarium sp. AF-6]
MVRSTMDVNPPRPRTAKTALLFIHPARDLSIPDRYEANHQSQLQIAAITVACIEVPSYSGELTLVLLARLHLQAHAYPETKPLWPLILDRPKAAFAFVL